MICNREEEVVLANCDGDEWSTVAQRWIGLSTMEPRERVANRGGEGWCGGAHCDLGTCVCFGKVTLPHRQSSLCRYGILLA